MDVIQNLTRLLPIITPGLFAFPPLILKALNGNRELNARVVLTVHFMGILTSLMLFLLLGFRGGEVLSLKFDIYSTGACALVALSALQSLPLFSLNQWVDKKQLTEILFLFSGGVSALYVFCLSQDLITAFISLETASLMVYMVMALGRKESLCLESAIKYFVLSSLAGAIFLYGLSFIFGATGTVDFASLKTLGREALFSRFLFLGAALLIAGLLFKMAIFPFQFWLADVYQGALTPTTSFMATGFKTAVILFTGKVFQLPLFNFHGEVFIRGLGVLSVLTVLFGSVMALRQVKLKRLAAFSSLTHSGYLMMALTGILSLTEQDFRPIFYYLTAYIFMTGGLFCAIQLLETKNSQTELADLRGLFKNQPWLAGGLSLFLLGLAGVPPVFGFFSKTALFQPLILSQNQWLLFWALIGSAMGMYYYIKPLTVMMEEGRGAGHRSRPAMALLFFSAFGTLFGAFIFGFFLS